MSSLFRALPALDTLLKTDQAVNLIEKFGRVAVVEQLRSILHSARLFIQQQQALPDFLNENLLFIELEKQLCLQQQVKMKPVFNLTGTVLHTNLGRSIWAEQAVEAATLAMRNNVLLEFDLDEGQRGHRDLAISQLLQRLTGAEAACVVNNNAAAVLLILSTFASGKEVVISRGELVEIGGAFRIPDIMRQAGCQLVEVGTTNRTHLKDYQANISENTAFLMKVHTSNYSIQGFTAAVDEAALVDLAKTFSLPVVSDLGSGSLVDLTQFGLPAEPLVQQQIAAGVDLVSFSGDKLLGGGQAGIIVGKKALIDRLQAHPLKRALRCDKVILTALEATLRLYLQPDKLKESLPNLQLFSQSLDLLQHKAERLKKVLEQRLAPHYQLQVEPSLAQIGSGALPSATLSSLAVTISASKQRDLLALEQQFKNFSQPILGRFAQQKLWLDLRSVSQFEALITMLEEK